MSDLSNSYLGRAEAAQFIGVDKCTLSRWFSEGVGPPRIKVGRRVLYLKTSIEEWLRSKEVSPSRDANPL
ncbi:helix-turn-helix transcriptional regulator [Hyphomonas oceanitis]|uniref:helix-turn-helix transcriptional regulator n=1 Tax=Hyphomonas oceanitis TaxID=81033 RepID=UPI003AB92D9D